MIEEWERGIYLSWDNLAHRKLILEGPDRIAEEAGLEEFLDTPPLIVLDEIQKYPEWKNYLKGLYDTYKGDSKVIVTGSSKLDVFVKGGDSLMGRYFILRIHPLTIGEIVQKKGPPEDREFRGKPAPISSKRLRTLLEFGGFPDPFLKGDRSFYNRWRCTRNKQIFQEDLRDLTKVKDLAGIETLAYLMREQVGQLASYSSFSKKIRMVSDKTIREWIEVLKSLHFFFEVRPYSRNLSKSLVKQPKYYLWDCSLSLPLKELWLKILSLLTSSKRSIFGTTLA
ncbi:hypothetical protein NEPTK9_001026 [Candidatus Neptunochlamydia vexilliferae]|uniref:AAA domain-containing protein n=1 Tax=Candidatus Neptunichlamydia vexilliferae TaxID=1651774 RepID=A0ABS0B0Z4_9BACT|nr:hypothetical protein [Candidatus Neptunochlamydia vexilliferae]